MTRNATNSSWLGSSLAVAAAALTLALTCVALYARGERPVAAEGRPPLPVNAVQFVEAKDYLRTQQFLGLVQATSHSEVGFEVPGMLDHVAVREGQRVTRGEVLATLDQQALTARRAAAEATVSQIEAELELANGRTQRQQPLAQNGAISAQTFDDTRLAERALSARLQAAQAQLKSIDIELEKATLRAPYAATVGRQIRDEGAVLQPGQPVFSLVAEDAREAHIGVAVEQAQHLVVGDEYPVSWRGNQQLARLRAVRQDVDPVTLTVVAIFDLPPEVRAFDGEPVAVSVPRRVQERGGWLPLSALLEGERGVWTVLRLEAGTSEPVAVREAVEVLHVSGDQVYVRGTLGDGDLLIADGVHRVAPGTRVRIGEV